MNRDFKKTKTREQVTAAFQDFVKGNKDTLVSVFSLRCAVSVNAKPPPGMWSFGPFCCCCPIGRQTHTDVHFLARSEICWLSPSVKIKKSLEDSLVLVPKQKSNGRQKSGV